MNRCRRILLLFLSLVLGAASLHAQAIPSGISVVVETKADKPYRPTPRRRAQLFQYFEYIKLEAFDWKKLGSVGEAVACMELAKTYPRPRYEVLSGLHYYDAEGNGLGELDVVVWDTLHAVAVEVYEVKTSVNLRRVRRHARGQMSRFRNALNEQRVANMVSEQHPERTFYARQFKGVELFGIIGTKGAIGEGYDIELDLTPEEAIYLQDQLLDYRKRQKGQGVAVDAVAMAAVFDAPLRNRCMEMRKAA